MSQATLRAFKNTIQTTVVVNHGWVTLDGEVEWQFQKMAAMNAVRYLTGVKGVSNQITVKPNISPGDVKEMIEAAFKRSAEIDSRRVSVEAHDGKVILRGNVRSWMEKEEAQRAAWAAPGVTTVDNRILVVHATGSHGRQTNEEVRYASVSE